MNTKRQVGVRMKEARQRAKLTQTAFADALQVTKQAVSSWENGRNDPPSDAILLLSERSGFPSDYILKGVSGKDMESQLLSIYRALPDDFKHALVNHANGLLSLASSVISAANPYPRKSHQRT